MEFKFRVNFSIKIGTVSTYSTPTSFPVPRTIQTLQLGSQLSKIVNFVLFIPNSSLLIPMQLARLMTCKCCSLTFSHLLILLSVSLNL